MMYLKRFSRLIFGLFVCAAGLYLSIRANVGLAPWDALNIGICLKSGISFGNANIIVGLIIISCDILLKEKIGIGSILNALLIGKFVDLLDFFDILPYQENFIKGIIMLFLGQFVLCLGCYFYMGSELGCGPRDTFMVAFGRKFDNFPIGVIRFFIELTVLIIGFLMGAKVGLGSVISMFGISFMMQITFDALHFNVKALKHENISETISNIFKNHHMPHAI